MGVAEAFPISDAYVAGLVLVTLGAGSAAGLKAAQLSRRADLPLAVSLVVVLQLTNIVAVPLQDEQGWKLHFFSDNSPTALVAGHGLRGRVHLLPMARLTGCPLVLFCAQHLPLKTAAARAF